MSCAKSEKCARRAAYWRLCETPVYVTQDIHRTFTKPFFWGRPVQISKCHSCSVSRFTTAYHRVALTFFLIYLDSAALFEPASAGECFHNGHGQRRRGAAKIACLQQRTAEAGGGGEWRSDRKCGSFNIKHGRDHSGVTRRVRAFPSYFLCPTLGIVFILKQS